MKLTNIIAYLPKLIEKGIVPLIVGEPGVGKSQIVEQVCAAMNWAFELYHPAMGMPSDIKGLPFKKSDTEAGFLPYELLARIRNATTTTVVLIDDLIQATDLMKAALMQLVECRTINGDPIPDCVKFVMATNDAKHNAGGTRIISPLIGRSCVVTVDVDPKGWIKWGIESKRIATELLFYIQTYPDSLANFESVKSIQNVPSPRNWERVSKLLEIGIDDTEMIAGCVGETEATRFKAFLKTIQDLKGVVPQVLQTPESAPLFTDGNQLDKFYALALALAHNASPKNLEPIYKYLKRSGGEQMEFALAQILMFKPELKETPTYINHICKVA